jgi:hypothetical protein
LTGKHEKPGHIFDFVECTFAIYYFKLHREAGLFGQNFGNGECKLSGLADGYAEFSRLMAK